MVSTRQSTKKEAFKAAIVGPFKNHGSNHIYLTYIKFLEPNQIKQDTNENLQQ